METQVQDDVVKLVAAYAQEADAAKKAALKAQLEAEIARRKAAEAQRPLPRYPVGLAATLGDNKAVVTAAAFQNGTWVYTVVINPDALIMTMTLTKPEAELKTLLAQQIGQPAGPAYPRGLLVFRNGQGGLIEDVKADGATWSYQVRGWPARVSEDQLAAILGK